MYRRSMLLVLLALIMGANGQTAMMLGDSQSNVIASDEGFHTYTVEVTDAVPYLVIFLDGEDVDLDMAVKYGGEILDYAEDVNIFLDQSPAADALYVLEDPQVGIYYVDVINFTDEDSDYRLETGTALPQGNVTLRATTTESTTVGMLGTSAEATGSLSGLTDGGGVNTTNNSYHTYMVIVPEGTERLKLEMRANGNLDLYAKYGSDILDYSDESEGGDWDHRNNSRRHRATLTIRNPQAGLWYVDVANGTERADALEYTLTVSTP